eukprot:CAMPEP_0170059964 /NCGR_PEP_ID=MMETSP0019_2-20121128/2056_1 /TAXON_ID=98059 /ORGANISM="Dinobryon sp., Strain UTEXLB2267" /LENGTH=417 /DNA_ID=CAMNT_0010265369 /DNA_START=15 /DNA_END=1268 /DNA_ORIENTATION=-
MVNEFPNGTKYFVSSGVRKDNGHLCYSVSKETLKESLNNFTSYTYGLGKPEVDDCRQLINFNEDKQFMHLLSNEHGLPFKTTLEGLKFSDIVIKDIGERAASNIYEVLSNDMRILKESATEHISKVFKVSDSVPVLKSKSSIEVKSFFSEDKDSTNKSENVKPKSKVSSKKQKSESEPTHQKTAKVTVVSKDDDDAEWDDDDEPTLKRKTSVKAVDENKSPVRDTIISPSKVDTNKSTTADDNDDEQKSSDNESESPQVVETTKRKPRKKKEVLHGAMDDFMTENDPENPSKPSNEENKRKKKKLVEKMSKDEKGYLVTEMVWEEFTDDESPPLPAAVESRIKKTVPEDTHDDNQETIVADIPAVIPPPSKAKKASKETKEPKEASQTSKGKKATTKAAASKSSGVQKSMTSFFGKN